MRAYCRPWYAILLVSSIYFLVGAGWAGTGQLTPLGNMMGWLSGLVMVFIAHGYWYSNKLSKQDIESLMDYLQKSDEKEVRGLKNDLNS